MSDSDTMIRVQGLGKKYNLRLGKNEKYTALRDVLSLQASLVGRRLLNPFTLAGQLGKVKRQVACKSAVIDEDFWALKDVSFEIRRGERVGIIGRNGAGKSTLLKILSRITEPTMGRVEIRGRVASLLEVGTGFHPELTGRENIFLNGAILGMKRREIRAKFDEIVSFAEVEKFLDLPVKRYSSGMYVRLAFAVAAHLDPDVLVVDEVLAVGDVNFQKKCISKLEEVADRDGRTVLLVSHQMPMVASLCNRCILLRDGQMADDGNPANVILSYQNDRTGGAAYVDYTQKSKKPGDHLASLLRGWIQNAQGQPCSDLPIEEPFSIHMEYEIFDSVIGDPCPNVHIYDSRGNCAFVTNASIDNSRFVESGIYRAVCNVPPNLLNDGCFSAGLALTFHQKTTHVSFFDQNVLNFVVIDSMEETPTRPADFNGSIPGVFRPLLPWHVTRVSNP